MKPSYMPEEVSILPELFFFFDWFVCLGFEGGQSAPRFSRSGISRLSEPDNLVRRSVWIMDPSV